MEKSGDVKVLFEMRVKDVKTGEVKIDTGIRSADSWLQEQNPVLSIAEGIVIEKFAAGSYILEVQASDSGRKQDGMAICDIHGRIEIAREEPANQALKADSFLQSAKAKKREHLYVGAKAPTLFCGRAYGGGCSVTFHLDDEIGEVFSGGDEELVGDAGGDTDDIACDNLVPGASINRGTALFIGSGGFGFGHGSTDDKRG